MPYAPRATFDNPYGPQVTFRTEDVLPPAAYYVSPQDQVGFVAVTDATGSIFNTSIRWLSPQGELKVELKSLQVNASGVQVLRTDYEPIEGYLLGAVAWMSGSGAGSCYAVIQIERAVGSQNTVVPARLAQGYVTGLEVIAYPDIGSTPLFSGRGTLLRQTAPNVTGSDWIFTVPPQQRWRVQGAQASLQASAAAGNRTVAFVARDSSGQPAGTYQHGGVQSAGQGVTYNLVPGGANQSQGPFQSFSGPADLFLGSGMSLSSQTYGLDGNDAWSSITVLVEEWVGF